MITPGYQIECDVCHKQEFFQEGEDATLVGDWYYGLPDNGGHLCTDCWNSHDNAREEQAKSPQQQNTEAWRRELRCSCADVARKRLAAHEDSIPYASAIRDNLNGEG